MRVALFVALALLVTAPAQALPRLEVERGDDAAIVDGRGRQALLRGINVNQLGDYYAADPALPTVLPLSERDFTAHRAPRLRRRPARDELVGPPARARRVRRAPTSRGSGRPSRWAARARAARRARHAPGRVGQAHRDTPGATCVPPRVPAARAGTARRSGRRSPTACPTCRATPARALARGRAGLRDLLRRPRRHPARRSCATWGRLAREFAADPNDRRLRPAQRAEHRACRSASTRPDAARRVLRAGDRRDPRRRAAAGRAASRTRVLRAERPVVGRRRRRRPAAGLHRRSARSSSRRTSTRRRSRRSRDGREPRSRRASTTPSGVAATYGAPFWSGEWGWFGDPLDARDRLERYAREEDARRLGGAWWSWKQACGDPHVVGYPGASGSLNPTDCPSGKPQGLVTGYTDLLRRAYPRYAPGRLTELESDWKSGRWSVRGRAGNAARAGSSCGCRARGRS